MLFLRRDHFWSKEKRLAPWFMLGVSRGRDWRANKYFPLAVILLIWTSLVVAAYYLNHPQAEPLADSWSYLYVVDQIQRHRQIVNFWRLPGYPLLIWSVYGLAGQGNLGAVSVAQAMLFVLSVLEFYLISGLLLRRAWFAFLLSLLVGSNVVLLSYVKPIMTEGMALWLLTTLALTVTLFLHTLRLRFFWLVVLWVLFLFFTRPEWIYLPPFLFAYLLLAACWRGVWRRFLAPSLLALLLLYSCLGGYTLLNAAQNHYPGITWIQNINLLGKVLQYRMVNETTPQDTSIGQMLIAYLKHGINDPYIILSEQPALARDYAARSGEVAKGIILHHPLEFLLKSVPVFFSSLTDFHLESPTLAGGPFGAPLFWLLNVFRALYHGNILFPLCALAWLLLLCSRKMRQREMVQKVGAVALLALYGLIVTTLGGYRTIDYARIYTVLEPLLFLTIGCTLLVPLLYLLARKERLAASIESSGTREDKTAQMGARENLRDRRTDVAWSVFPYKAALFLPLCLLLFIWGGPRTSAARVSPRLVPLLCHRESDATMLRGTGVGILFITVENRGQDAGPSTMRLEFATNSPAVPWISLNQALPALPAGAYRYLMVDIPRISPEGDFLDPVGPVTISLEISGISWPDGVLVTNC